MDEADQNIATYLTSAPGSGFYGQPVAVAGRWQGAENLLWRVEARGQDAVVKFFVEAGQVRSQRQFTGQELLSGLGIAPEPLWLDRFPEGLTREVVVYRWMDGNQLDISDGRRAAALAQTLAQLHGYDREAVQRFCPHPINLDYYWRITGYSVGQAAGWLGREGYVRLAGVVDALGAAGRQLVERALPLWRDPPRPVHGDVRPENCLDSFGTAVLVDWELFGLGDPALEVASLLWETQAQLDEAARDELQAAYVDALGEPEIAARIDVYNRLLPLRNAAFLLNGVSQLDADDRAQAEFRANQVFIRETVLTSLALAAGRLAPMDLRAESGIREDLQRLIGGDEELES